LFSLLQLATALCVLENHIIFFVLMTHNKRIADHILGRSLRATTFNRTKCKMFGDVDGHDLYNMTTLKTKNESSSEKKRKSKFS
jgi:hypothetical protein